MEICDLFSFETIKIHQAEKKIPIVSPGEMYRDQIIIEMWRTQAGFGFLGFGFWGFFSFSYFVRSMYVNNHLHIQRSCLMPIPHSVRWAKRGGYFLQRVGFDFFLKLSVMMPSGTNKISLYLQQSYFGLYFAFDYIRNDSLQGLISMWLLAPLPSQSSATSWLSWDASTQTALTYAQFVWL